MDPLKTLEKQSGFMRLISYLTESGEKPLTTILDETGIPVHQLYASIGKAKELGLVRTRMDSSVYPPRNLVSLTDKGKKIGGKIGEIMEIMESD